MIQLTFTPSHLQCTGYCCQLERPRASMSSTVSKMQFICVLLLSAHPRQAFIPACLSSCEPQQWPGFVGSVSAWLAMDACCYLSRFNNCRNLKRTRCLGFALVFPGRLQAFCITRYCSCSKSEEPIFLTRVAGLKIYKVQP